MTNRIKTALILGVTPLFQVIISGIAFGLAHTIWILSKGDFKFTIPAILSTTILGNLLAIIYIVGDRNVGPCIYANVLINIIIEPWLMLSSVTGIRSAYQMSPSR